jgi:hypothetical protein
MGQQHFDRRRKPRIQLICSELLSEFKKRGISIREIVLIGGYARDIYSEHHQTFDTNIQKVCNGTEKSGADFDVLILSDKGTVEMADIEAVSMALNEGRGKHEAVTDKELYIDIWCNVNVDKDDQAIVVWPKTDYQKYN